MDFRKVIIQYRKQPSTRVQDLWDYVNKAGVTPNHLRDILMFYLHHRLYPPVLQKSFDTVVMKLSEKNITKKMRNVLVQIADEISHFLDPSTIIDGLRMSGNNINADLLNCLLQNTTQPIVDDNVFNRLLSMLNETNITVSSVGDRCKIFSFLITFCPTKFSGQLSKLMAEWMQFSQPQPTVHQLFSRSEITELDGSAPVSLTTVLSLSTNMSTGHIMSVITFTNLRLWLSSSAYYSTLNQEILMATLGHCSVLVEQCLKKPTSQDDILLRTSVLCEIMDLVHLVVQINSDLLEEALLVVKKIRAYKDVALRIRVWKFYLCFDETKSEEFSHICLQDCISRCFTLGLDCYELLTIIMEKADILSPMLVKYHPNLLKIFATHPQALLEEFIEVVPYLAKTCETYEAVEIFHRLVDLPVLSAVICVQQTPQLNQAGYSDPLLIKFFDAVQTSNNRLVFEYFLRSSTGDHKTSDLISLYPEFFSLLERLNNQGLVQTCSQACPLLLDVFLRTASADAEISKALLPLMLTRLALIFQVPGYREEFCSLICDHLKEMFAAHPDLTSHESIIQFVTNIKNIDLCPSVYLHLIWALGEYTNKPEQLSQHFEVIECALWEILTSKSDHTLEQLRAMVTTLARLSCRSQDLLPRAVLSLNKVLLKIEVDSSDPEILALNQLATLLKNPSVASVVLAPASEGDKTMASMLKAVTLFTGS